MKKFIYPTLTILLTIVISSCNKRPVADFTMDVENPEPNQVIHFTSTSVDAATYEWDFGDGTSSTAENPAHIYTQAGSYFVELTVTNKKGKKSDSHAVLVTVENNVLDLMCHKWDYDEIQQRTYTNGVLTNSITTDISTLFSVATVEFKTDLTYENIFDGITDNGTWYLNSNQTFFVTNNTDTSYISQLNTSTFVFAGVQTQIVGQDVVVDSSFSVMSR